MHWQICPAAAELHGTQARNGITCVPGMVQHNHQCCSSTPNQRAINKAPSPPAHVCGSTALSAVDNMQQCKDAQVPRYCNSRAQHGCMLWRRGLRASKSHAGLVHDLQTMVIAIAHPVGWVANHRQAGCRPWHRVHTLSRPLPKGWQSNQNNM
jgi:hypothetical protein